MLLRSTLALTLLGALAACGAAGDNTSGTAPGAGVGAATGAGGSGILFGGSGGAGNGTGATGSAGVYGVDTRPIDGTCSANVSQGEELPLDIYIMFDVSLSMSADVGNGQNRLDAERAALTQFIADPASNGIGVGIGYFGYMGVGTTSCNPTDYQNAEVPIAPLPGNAAPITQSLASKSPTGETPTPAAIRGAATYAKAWAQAHPSHVTVILLVTDGVPEAPLSQLFGCSPSLPDAVQAATDCAGQPPQVPIYLLGVGPSLQNLQQIAQAGGTKQAYLVEGGNVEQQVLAALNTIRGSAQVPCQYTIPPPPPGKTFDKNLVNIQYTPPSGQPGIVYAVDSEATCDPAAGGWYFSPDGTLIKLCPVTCTQATSQAGGLVEVAFGCQTKHSTR